ncbi:vesicle transport protein [Syncephalis plumigaleata]|nr:vesicle transport protein [Syncephalis plumigaleata]
MLPPATLTTTPSREEVDFRRLLVRTEDLLSRNDTNTLCITPETAKLATNLRTLRTTLEDWNESKEDSMSNIYQRVSPIDLSLSHNRSASFVQAQGKERLQESIQELRLRRQAEKVMKEALLQERQQRSNNAVDGHQLRNNDDLRKELLSGQSTSMSGSNEDLESILRRDRAIHNELTDDMARLASVLKNNVTAFGDILRKDQQVVSDMQSTMTTSVDRLSREGNRLGVFRKQAGKTTVFTWTVLLIVCLVFVFTFMFIRLFPKQY